MTRVALLSIVLISVTLGAVIDVPLTVKDGSGYGSKNYPVIVVVPLPYGQFQDTSNFRITDSSLTSVPCQFEIQTRWYYKDNSLREVRAYFLATVSAFTNTTGTGTSTYHFRTDGSGNVSPTTNAVSVTTNSDSFSVSNGILQFDVLRKNFTTLTNVKLNGNAIMTSTGGSVLDYTGETQLDTSLTLNTVEIEENGPVRVVIRAQADAVFSKCTEFNFTSYCDSININQCSDDKPRQIFHGFAVRIYAYAGASFVKMEYQLGNAVANKIAGAPFYFKSMQLNYPTSLTGTSKVTIGTGGSAYYQGNLANTIKVLQKEPAQSGDTWVNQFVIKDASKQLQAGAQPVGFLDVTDSSKGVMTFIRDFWESWPNAISTTLKSGSISISPELFPSEACMWNSPDAGGGCNVNNIYWLDDMQAVIKEVDFWFHDATATPADMIAMARNFQWFPVVIIPTSWYSNTSVSLDMGYVPNIPEQNDDTNRNLDQSRLDSLTGEYTNPSQGTYGFHWRNFGALAPGYRDKSCTTGSWPDGIAKVIVSQQSADWYQAHTFGYGELNNRPQHLYGYKAKKTGIMSASGYCGDSWRFYCGNDAPKTAFGYFVSDTALKVNARDDEHGWHQSTLEAYALTGNLWMRDWHQFLGEFRRGARFFEKFTPYPDDSARAVGHSFNGAAIAMRNINDPTLVADAQTWFQTVIYPNFDLLWGGLKLEYSDTGYGYQSGFLLRSWICYYDLISDATLKAQLLHLIAGSMSVNKLVGNYAYYCRWWELTPGQTCPSSGTSAVNVDPVVWYWDHTGDNDAITHMFKYLNGGIDASDGSKGEGCYYNFNSSWSGDYNGRYFYKLSLPRDYTTRPKAVSDLRIEMNTDASVMTLSWTTPANAAKFHFLWSDLPINATGFDTVGKTRNWWASNVVGTDMAATSGTYQTIKIDLNKTAAFIPRENATQVFAAMYTFDSQGNMSPISNLVCSSGPVNCVNPAAPPPGAATSLSTPVTGSQVTGTAEVSSAASLIAALTLSFAALFF